MRHRETAAASSLRLTLPAGPRLPTLRSVAEDGACSLAVRGARALAETGAAYGFLLHGGQERVVTLPLALDSSSDRLPIDS